jgi:hypothetical protein
VSRRGRSPVERVRSICLALPGVTEKRSHGEPTWFVGTGKTNRTFANLAQHHHDDRLAVWCAAPDGAQEALVAAEPERFFRPPYVGHRGWLGVYLDVSGVDWDLVAELLRAAWREVAPPKLAAAEQRAPRGRSR